MTPSLVANPVASSDRSRDRRRKKKKKSQVQSRAQQSSQAAPSHARWKSESQQQVYCSKLAQALSQVRLGEAAAAAPPRGRAVREAADRALAFAAKGRTRWSRAILTNRVKLRFRRQRRVRSASAVAALTGSGRAKKPRVSVLRLKGKSLPAVQKKVKVLGGLIPGCRKEPLPVILEEATDYIAALEMQVRAMSALARLLSGGAGSSSDAVSEQPPPSG